MIKKNIVSFMSATVATIIITSNAYSADIAFPDVPLFLKEELAPNIILTLDNSTSMQRADIFDADVYCPEIDTNETSNPSGKTIQRVCWTAPALNKVYYNPAITYQLPLKADGSSYLPARFDAAPIDGFDESPDRILVDLRTDYIPTYNYLRLKTNTPVHEFVEFELNEKRAYYSLFNPNFDPDPSDPSTPDCSTITNSNYNSDLADSCFEIISIIGEDEEQNFANWYSYYRTRLLITKSAASIAFALIGSDIRVGWNDINILTKFDTTNANYVSPFTGTHKDNFYTWLATMNQDFGTPLIPALKVVGDYVSSRDNLNPFAINPGAENYDPSTDLSCRQNYNVMFTDGAWTYREPDINLANDFDNQSIILPDDTEFVAGTAPYSAPAPAADFLSDWSFYYWATDLRPDLADTLTPFYSDQSGTTAEQYFNPANDPATWQHLVNYTVTLGVDGNLSYPGSLPGLIDGTEEWPTNGSNEGTRIDDTWHTAINSRGAYFSASNTTELTNAFSEILNRISARDASASAVSSDSTQAADTEYLYRAGFSSGSWGGTLQGFPFTDLVIGTIAFDAGCELTGGDCESTGQIDLTPQEPIDETVTGARRIITSSGVSTETMAVTKPGVPFRAGSFSLEQKLLLNTQTLTPNPDTGQPNPGDTGNADLVLDYIRGERTNEEQRNGEFRDRENVLGDIINSSPALVVSPQRTYPNQGNWKDLWHNSTNAMSENAQDVMSFGDFITQESITERTGIVYVGANDGMLHAFNGETGIEEFAYIPSVLVPKLNQLTDPDYSHKFYVDGTPNAGEAFFDGEWHSVVTGHLRSGGQMVYALDATYEPLPGDKEVNISERLLWEFTSPDLGYGYGEPQIARLHNNKWAVIFGNGYNNSEADGDQGSGTASIFIVDIETGSLIKKLDTANGTLADSNGIGSVTTVDADGDFITDFVYGGDLNGNLWKFDLTSKDENDWSVAYTDSSTGKPEPLFKAISPSGEPQAITERPSVVKIVADGKFSGVTVIFGTGKYLEESDNFDTDVVNSFYGIWDRDVKNTETTSAIVPAIKRENLALRTLSADTTNNPGGSTTVTVRTIAGNDVQYTESTPLEPPTILGWYFDFFEGELQFTETLTFNDSLVNFTTFEPNVDECTRGGVSYLYVIDAFQGKDPGFTPLDVDGNGSFDGFDDAVGELFASAVRLEGSGVIAPLSILNKNPISTDSGVENFASLQFNNVDNVLDFRDIVDKSTVSEGGRVQWRQIK